MKPDASAHRLGPVSAALEAELREEVRKHGIVFFLDKEGAYTPFIDRLAAAEGPYPVRAFRGSFLELLLALEGHAAGVDRTPLLVHLPGFVEDDVKASPFYEMYVGGKRYRKALDTLVSDAAHGRVPPDQIAAFRSQGSFTLEGADAWLSAVDAAGGQGLDALLRGMTLEAILDDLLSGGFIAGRIHSAEDAEEVWQHFAKGTGLIKEWRETYEGRKVPRARDVAFTAVSWILIVEYTMDLTRAPVDARLALIPELPKKVIETCRGIADYLRSRHAEFYAAAANETETWIGSATSKTP